MKKTILKFGGTSMGTAKSIKQVADIVLKTKGQKVVVVSATSGTTDLLIKFGEMALSGGDWELKIKELQKKHNKIAQELNINLDFLDLYFNDIYKLLEGISLISELSLSARDRLISYGEKISSQILANFLREQSGNSEAVDAYELIFTDNNFSEGNVNFKKTEKAIKRKIYPMLEKNVIPVVTGFVAQAENGCRITLGRGGSDYTASLIASGISGDELQIWTDVDGVFNVDPNLISNAEVLKQISFNEAGELAYFGAKMIHPKTIKPAIKKNISVRILNTFNPLTKGTLINNKETNILKSVTYKKGISIINVCSAGMFLAKGFLAKLFEVFARNGISVDVVSTSEVSVSLTVDKKISKDVIKELKEFSKVEVYENMAIVCLVGAGIRANTKVLGDLFSGIEKYDVSMVSLGASKRNITFLVYQDNVKKVVNKVFNIFFNQ